MAAAVIGGGGCALYSPGGPEALSHVCEPLPAEAWPARETRRLSQIAAGLPTTVTAPATRTWESDGGEILVQQVTRVVGRFIDSVPAGQGIVRRYRVWSAQAGRRYGYRFFSFGPGMFAEGENPASRLEPVGLDLAYTHPDGTRQILRGVSMRLLGPEPLDMRPRGLIIHLNSFGGAEYEAPVIDRLRTRGWVVLSVGPPDPSGQTRSLQVDVQSDEDFESAGREIAAFVDDRLAEHAYAVEAALEYFRRRRPSLPQRPAVIMGFSAGAIVAPAVAARLDDRFDAAVLVGGGADLLDVAFRSGLTDGGISVRWGDGYGDAPDRLELSRAYLRHARLDPYHTALIVRTRPVLVLHAMFDAIVPAGAGDLLLRRLGRPERFVFPLGHQGLFWRLPSHADRIADWVEENAAPHLRTESRTPQTEAARR